VSDAVTIHRTIALASTNPGKIREFAALLPPGIGIVSLRELSADVPEETGATFAENAAIKSLALSRSVDMVVVADDSGLEVDALGGAPGVRSARYAGEPADDDRNVDLLLARMADVPDDERIARFRCAVSVARHGRELLTASGTCEGRIGHARRGQNGFGYDPVFVLDDGRTMAELAPEEKNRISHRSRAFRAVAEPLRLLVDELFPAGDGSQ
jgi:XTP/dITP diphosphohydrolase